MLGVDLVAYLFHEMDERLKGVPTFKLECKGKHLQRDKSYTSDLDNKETRMNFNLIFLYIFDLLYNREARQKKKDTKF